MSFKGFFAPSYGSGQFLLATTPTANHDLSPSGRANGITITNLSSTDPFYYAIGDENVTASSESAVLTALNSATIAKNPSDTHIAFLRITGDVAVHIIEGGLL